MNTPLSRTPGAARVAGGLGLAHLALLVTGLAMSGGGALIEDGTAGIEEAYGQGDLTMILGGWLVESIGFVLLVPVAVFLASTMGRSSQWGRWAARTGLVMAGTYVAVTLAVGFPAGAAAAYGFQHDLDVAAASALNSMRVFAYLLSLLCLGAHVTCVALSALADGFGRRWVTGLGLLTGAALLAAPPLAAVGQQDSPTLVYIVWWVGLCVILLRHRPAPDADHTATPGAGHTAAPGADAELRGV
ncbi:hypothetical protein [Ornithinimicrobium cavernae]|uniref:hypothetical protein n=1 Tax=Ornithinimicrobium cavernae TaxID=2666047 RepID=UPI000D6934B9|nr:hypothetical protein [Ornithinimicrobium cavernae]